MATNQIEYTKDFFKKMLETNDGWLVRSIVVIYERQTDDEQLADQTSHKNGVGFNGLDAPFLSSLARQAMAASEKPLNKVKDEKGAETILWNRCLSQKQIAAARKVMKKYAGQLLEIAQAKRPPEAKEETTKKAPKGHPGFRIIWPDENKISVSTAWKWVRDAYSNGDIDGPLDLTIDELMEQLEQSGKITMAHRKSSKVDAQVEAAERKAWDGKP